MKKFMKFVVEWKAAASLMFTASVMLFLVVCLFRGETVVRTSTVWSILVVSLLGTHIQLLCFTDLVIKKLRYTLRSLLFAVLFLALLAVAAWAFAWFPVGDAGQWLIFVGIFLAVFLVMTIGFEIYFAAAGKKYDGLLGQYRREKEAQTK